MDIICGNTTILHFDKNFEFSYVLSTSKDTNSYSIQWFGNEKLVLGSDFKDVNLKNVIPQVLKHSFDMSQRACLEKLTKTLSA